MATTGLYIVRPFSLSPDKGTSEKSERTENRSFISAFCPFSAYHDCTFVCSVFGAFIRCEHLPCPILPLITTPAHTLPPIPPLFHAGVPFLYASLLSSVRSPSLFPKEKLDENMMLIKKRTIITKTTLQTSWHTRIRLFPHRWQANSTRVVHAGSKPWRSGSNPHTRVRHRWEKGGDASLIPTFHSLLVLLLI